MRAVALTLAALLAAPLMTGVPVGATAVGCGSTISVSTTLTKDLDCTTDVGLTVIPGVTLDLGGHSVSGAGSGIGIVLAWPEEAAGPSSTVKNGTIGGWTKGIADSQDGSSRQGSARLHRLTLSHNDVGLDSWGSKYTVTSSRFTDNRVGFGSMSTFSTVSDSTFVDNAEYGIGLDYSGSVEVAKSKFVRTGVAISVSEVSLSVRGSTFRDNDTAVTAFNAGTTTLADNTLTGNDIGYQVDEYGWGTNEIIGNRFTDNGVAIDTGITTRLVRNVFTGNDTAFHSRLSELYDTPATLEWNLFAFNRDAVVIDSLASLRGTVAIKNSGIGIHAPLATDLGANRAWGNGAQPQCVGVAC